jgi:rubredoxin
MSYLDIDNPFTEPPNDFECRVCGKSMEEDGVCSNTCFEADMR